MINLKDFPLYSEKFLRQKSVPVYNEAEASALKEELLDKFPKTGAYAVACPQIGILKRACLIKLPSNGAFLFICNPEIISQETPIPFTREGCLSFPKKEKNTVRFNEVKVKFYSEQLEEQIVVVTGLEAVIFQHEIDHLDGILYKDKIVLPIRAEATVGRNEPCPCNSGIKYKKCCGK